MSQTKLPKSRTLACILAFAGVAVPGLHKFYLGQMGWGAVYLLLSFTPISHVASVAEGLWYLLQGNQAFNERFNVGSSVGIAAASPAKRDQAIATADAVASVAEALRHLDQLRQEGLMSEYEFEQKRRQLLDHI
ncbi:MAG TPA: NINE protein [Synechococcales cyanobacterium M55_K2018_004]|nr:NINE protein [Synechococcales cyanobacterium M55_K2018_004]